MSDDDNWRDPLVYSDEVKAKMAADPELAAAMREMAASMRQAWQGWKEGRYASFDDAMEAITGQRPEPVDPDDPDYAAAKDALAATDEE